MCQIKNIEKMDCRDPLTKVTEQLLFSLKHPLQSIVIFLKKRFGFFSQHFNRSDKKNGNINYLKNTASDLKPGDLVKIRSKDQILQTLDKNNKLKGCYFMDEMWQYCGTQQRVLKRVNYFYDEGNFQMRKAKKTVLLDGLHCHGIVSDSKQRCDRHCLFFWREEWLEKIDKTPIQQRNK